MISGSEKFRYFHKDPSSPAREPPQKEGIVLSILEAFLRRQIERYIQLGFHKALDMSEEEYRSSFSFSHLLLQPDSYRRRFDIFLTVDPRIPVVEQFERAGVHEHKPDILASSDTVLVSSKPYIAWVQTGRRYFGTKIQEAIKNFREIETGSPLIELAALFIQNPDILYPPINNGIAASAFEKDYVPLLEFAYGRTMVRNVWVGYKFCRVMSRGKDIQIAA